MAEQPYYYEWQGLAESSKKYHDAFNHVVDDLTKQLREATAEIERHAKFMTLQASQITHAQERIRSLEIRFGIWEELKEEKSHE